MRLTLAIILLLAMIFPCYQVWVKSLERQKIIYDYSEVANIRHGIFSIDNWKKQVSEILAVKIKELELSYESREELRNELIRLMNHLIDEVEIIINREEASNNQHWLLRMAREVRNEISRFIRRLVLDINELRKEVPGFADKLMHELDKQETREKLSLFIERQIDAAISDGETGFNQQALREVAKNNDCSLIDGCKYALQEKKKQLDASLNLHTTIALLLSVFIFLVVFFKNRQLTPNHYFVITALCVLLLIPGVSSPMIDIDARISEFQFLLLGAPISFSDQILFLESKSILEVVTLLFRSGNFQSLLVGGLVLLFSVVFPLSKLLASVLLINQAQRRKNRFLSFLALKSGKWSMADVFVVAIFMAYIGFKGLIGSQLRQLESTGPTTQLLTTDHSNFGVGFIFFIAYCIAGLVLAGFLDRGIQDQKKVNNTEGEDYLSKS